jgi:catechol 2,3-dioxygenase-like lactoylglutathione lyase family enzyme
MARQFEVHGLNHLALVCSDMARTVDFYQGLLGFPLVKTIELPGGGQHFFFDIGNGACLAFFWFPGAPPGEPGVSGPRALPGVGDFESAIGSMNHVAIDIDPDRIDEYRDRLTALGVECSPVLNHDDSEWGVARDVHPGVFVRSVYFFGPDGILLEFAGWTRPLGSGDVRHAPVRRPAQASASS